MMVKLWTPSIILFMCLVTVNAYSYNYGHGNYYNPLVPQRSNVQHYRVELVNRQFNHQNFAQQNQQYHPAASNNVPQQNAINPNQLVREQVIKGDYISQSESAQLDQSAYPYKQRLPGDTRAFKRFVTTCYPGGRCDNQNSDVNNVDQSHQNVLYQFRAQIQNNAFQGAYHGAASQNVLTSVPPRNEREYLPPAALCQNHGLQNINAAYSAQASQQVSNQFAQSSANSFANPPERRLYPYYEAVSSISFN